MVKLLAVPEETYAAMRRIRETALVRFDSLFVPERKLWTLENLRHFHTLFVERFDSGKGSFLEKWKEQLDGANDDILQLAAELLYVQQFFTSVTGPQKKLENVTAVLSWITRPPTIPEWAVLGIQRGLAGDQSFNQHRPHHLAWLSEFLIHWQELSDSKRTELLKDPWHFAKEVRHVEFTRGAYQPMQEAWLYIVFPDEFENISSRKDKRRIRDAFHERLSNGSTENIDSDLLDIRKRLTSQVGEGFHFYRSPVVERWREASISAHDIELVRQSRSRDRYADFSNEERNAYKRVHEALRQLGETTIAELGGTENYVLKLTPGFHPNSGIVEGSLRTCGSAFIEKKMRAAFWESHNSS